MVATAAQIAANRANAQRSTGPRTPEGKAASSRNALTHGANASDDTILATTPNVYLDAFRARFQPADALEAHLVEHLAVLALRRDRLNAAMDALLELNERHALTEHLHERYGINTPNARIPGQPSWQAAMRRYDDNTYVDSRFPEPVSDPALDPDPILCSLAYTLSGPRAAALFRHEASVDRRFSATLKELTTLQAQRRTAAAAAATTPPATPLYEPRLQRALDRYLRATATPANPPRDPIPASAPPPLAGSPSAPTDPVPAPLAENKAQVADQTQSDGQIGGSATIAPAIGKTGGNSTAVGGPAQNPQNEPSAHLDHTTAAINILADAATRDRSRPVRCHPTAVGGPPQDQQNEAATLYDLPGDETGGFLSVLPRCPGEPSSIPAHR
jgi:hypothetical protein